MDPLEVHRQLLGVPRDADRAEITAAYRRRVKDVHPDRHPHASAADRREREEETATLNRSYGVLLAHVGAAPEAPVEAPVEGHVDEPTEQPFEAPVEETAEPDVVVPTTRRAGWVRTRVLGLAAAVLLLAGAGAVVLATRESPAPGLAVGRCVAWTGGFSVVDCAERHDGQVSTVVDRAGDCPSGGFARSHGRVYCIDTRS